MNFFTRLLATRVRAVPASAALMMGLLGSSGAWAQCVDNGLPPGFAAALLPFGQGGSVNSLVSVINTVNTAFLTNTTAFVSAPSGPQPNQQGGGAWGRVIAGTADTEATGITTVVSGGAPVAGNQTCNTTTRQNYSGYQVGQDISILNGGATGANFHFGITAGYFTADAKDISAGGTFRGHTEVPFAGLYAAFTKGNFFADGQVRLDAYQNEITDPANNIAGQQFNARGLSLTANAGYNVPLHNNWFIEPSGGVVWSRVKIDPIDVAGPSIGGVFQVPGSVQVEDVESLLGRASVRVGTNFTSGNMAWQPFFTASVIHEFAGDVSTRLTPAPGGVFFGVVDSGTLTTSRIGTYGQFGLGTAAVLLNTGWLGYARVDYRTGENIDSWSVNAGLRYQFAPPPSRGSVKDGAPTMAWDTYNWAGLYAGAFAGKTWGGQDWTFLDPPNTSVNPIFGGYVLGGTVGYNVQVGNMVFGLEGDFGDANGKGARSCPNAFFNCENELNNLGSFTGRVGVTSGRALFYAKGGLAFGEVGAGTFLKAFPATGALPLTTTNWQAGWTVGGGMEFAISDRWSAKGEIMYYDLGKDTFTTFVFPPLTGQTDVDTIGRVVRVGVNYHFNRQPDPAPLK